MDCVAGASLGVGLRIVLRTTRYVTFGLISTNIAFVEGGARATLRRVTHHNCKHFMHEDIVVKRPRWTPFAISCLRRDLARP